MFGLEGISPYVIGTCLIESQTGSSWWVDRMWNVNSLVHRRYSRWDKWAREFILCSTWECYERGSS